MWDVSSPTGMEHTPLYWKLEVLTTGPPGKPKSSAFNHHIRSSHKEIICDSFKKKRSKFLTTGLDKKKRERVSWKKVSFKGPLKKELPGRGNISRSVSAWGAEAEGWEKRAREGWGGGGLAASSLWIHPLLGLQPTQVAGIQGTLHSQRARTGGGGKGLSTRLLEGMKG